MGRIIACLLTVFFASYSPALLACSPVDFDTPSLAIFSYIPGQNVPKGAIQLKVDSDNYAKSGPRKMLLPVKEVLNGNYTASSILLNDSNVSECGDGFGALGEKNAYITVLPMQYSDGEPILNRQGVQEFGGLFYKDGDLVYPEGYDTPDFVEYSQYHDFSFHDPIRLHCIEKGGDTADVWRKCISAGEYLSLDCKNNNAGALICDQNDASRNRPLDLKRGYNFWTAYGATIVTILLVISTLIGISYFSRVRAVT